MDNVDIDMEQTSNWSNLSSNIIVYCNSLPQPSFQVPTLKKKETKKQTLCEAKIKSNTSLKMPNCFAFQTTIKREVYDQFLSCSHISAPFFSSNWLTLQQHEC